MSENEQKPLGKNIEITYHPHKKSIIKLVDLSNEKNVKKDEQYLSTKDIEEFLHLVFNETKDESVRCGEEFDPNYDNIAYDKQFLVGEEISTLRSTDQTNKTIQTTTKEKDIVYKTKQRDISEVYEPIYEKVV
jgi:hypothetical protein